MKKVTLRVLMCAMALPVIWPVLLPAQAPPNDAGSVVTEARLNGSGSAKIDAGGEQTPPPSGTAAQQSTRPKNFGFTGDVTAGFQIETGSTNLRGIDIAFQTFHKYMDRGNFVFRAGHRFGKTIIRDNPRLEKVLADRTYGQVGFDHDIHKRGIFMARTIYTRDAVQRLDYRIEQMTGVGLRLIKEKKAEFRFVPGFSVLNENKNFLEEVGTEIGGGFFTDLQYKINATWTFDERLLYRRNFERTDDFTIDGSAALTGMITKAMALQTEFVHTHENLVRPGAIKRYQKIMVGLKYKF